MSTLQAVNFGIASVALCTTYAPTQNPNNFRLSRPVPNVEVWTLTFALRSDCDSTQIQLESRPVQAADLAGLSSGGLNFSSSSFSLAARLPGLPASIQGPVPDTTPPTVELSGAPDAVNTTNPFDVTATFSEAVTEFVTIDLTVENASVVIPGDGPAYTLAVTPDGSGDDITLSIEAGVTMDAAGNGNAASSAVTVTFNGPNAPEIAVTRGPRI